MVHRTAHIKMQEAQYKASSIRKTGRTAVAFRDAGAAAEHLVISDLLERGLPVGGPYNMNGKHDLFVKTGGDWRTVQVKMGRINTKTGVIQLGLSRKTIFSDLIAMVDLEDKRIRWISNIPGLSVPEELTREA